MSNPTTSHPRIAITGASGQLGRLVIAELLARIPATQVRALVRIPAAVAGLGVEAVAADYDRPEGLPGALAGIDTLLLISSNQIGQRARQHRAVLAAARTAGVRRVVYTSLLRADTSLLGLADEHRETETVLRRSGVDWTILRNGWYTENYTGSLGAALAGGALLGSAGSGRIASAARADYAAAAAAVLTTPGHHQAVYELAGDSAWTLADLAAELSRQSGRAIPYQDLPEADYARILTGVGLPEWFAQAIAGWDVAASCGALDDHGRQLSRLIGRPTTTLSASVAAALAAVPR